MEIVIEDLIQWILDERLNFKDTLPPGEKSTDTETGLDFKPDDFLDTDYLFHCIVDMLPTYMRRSYEADYLRADSNRQAKLAALYSAERRLKDAERYQRPTEEVDHMATLVKKLRDNLRR